MALINCPECNTEVSEKADKCPKCAYPINKIPHPNNVNQEIVVKAKEGCFLQTLNAGCMIIAVILGIIGLIFFVALCSH